MVYYLGQFPAKILRIFL